MANIKEKLLIILTTTIFLGCSNMEDLGDDYYYLSDFDAMDVGYPYGSVIYKSSNINAFEKSIIYSDIKNVNYNGRYIIAHQNPNPKLMIKTLEDDLQLWNDYYLTNKKDSLIELDFGKISLIKIHNLIEKKGFKNIEIIADSIFNNELFYNNIFERKENYYIINKENDSVFGPLNLQDFESLKTKKNIDLDF